MEKEKLIEELIDGSRDVFSTMAMVEVTALGLAGTSRDKQSDLTSIIGLGGDIAGVLSIHCTERFAKGVTAALLGMEVAEIDDDVKDAVAEIANMIAGAVKISFERRKKNIKLAIPTTVIGKSLKFSGGGGNHITIPFSSDVGAFWVELSYKD